MPGPGTGPRRGPALEKHCCSWHSCEKVERESATIIERCILLIHLLTVLPDTESLIGNI